MGELEIPDAAVQIVADHCFGGEDISEDVAHDVASVALEDAAPLVVADELRRMARVLDERREGIYNFVPLPLDGRAIRFRIRGEAVTALRARADELDGNA